MAASHRTGLLELKGGWIVGEGVAERPMCSDGEAAASSDLEHPCSSTGPPDTCEDDPVNMHAAEAMHSADAMHSAEAEGGLST